MASISLSPHFGGHNASIYAFKARAYTMRNKKFSIPLRMLEHRTGD